MSDVGFNLVDRKEEQVCYERLWSRFDTLDDEIDKVGRTNVDRNIYNNLVSTQDDLEAMVCAIKGLHDGEIDALQHENQELKNAILVMAKSIR